MKKIIYLIAVIAVFFTACDPMEDINNELDSQENVVKGESNFTLTSDDYADIDPENDDDDYENFESFSSIEDAKDKIPTLLNSKFPVWGKGSLAEVTFNLYRSNSIQNEESYEVTPQDYTDAGFSYPNFGSAGDIKTFLDFKYPSPSRGDLIELTYEYHIGGGNTEERTDKVIYFEEWITTTQFSNADYTAMGQNYSNFSNRDVAQYRIGIYLKTLYPFAMNGDEITTLYKFWNSGVSDKIARYTYDGSDWFYVGSTTEQAVKFGHNGSVWMPDNTINYTLTNADYALVGNGSYNNFDVREGKDEEMESVRLDKINTILLNNFPSNAEGQKYSVSYAVWNNANEVWNLNVILEGGVYIKNE